MPVRILLVDDNDDFRLVMSQQLAREGFEVMDARDGEKALELLDGSRVDLILLDLRMPRLNGIDVLKRLRQVERAPIVIVLTAIEDVAVAVEACKLGAVDYLTKPVDLDGLLLCIRKFTATDEHEL